MKTHTTTLLASLAVAAALFQSGCATGTVEDLAAQNAAQINADATAALQTLYAVNPAAKDLGTKARAILIFPDVVKGGFMIGGELGNGVLRQNGRTTGYYNITAASYGFQAGLQTFGYALFLMNDRAMNYLSASDGWQIGVGPSVVVVDEGMAKTITTTTLTQDVYSFVFAQSGLMAGVGMEGSKITRIQP